VRKVHFPNSEFYRLELHNCMRLDEYFMRHPVRKVHYPNAEFHRLELHNCMRLDEYFIVYGKEYL
jgi:hypothetical protein